ncbi:DegT/DnrJ/EryC1/StrS family aminotransferase [Thermanaerothrix sp.]|jgi:dTDP-4-amino-4,6-dideoxygalactose transaminase|uniref:DegT/DnrJ/EryC1/StrS family aminotransferase n=1 Tax=Thermanaerothrix sp. TaxID=2972675 RepID=UPI002ADD7720|nr:DegT/DnrJ/EryC1/StrS family aminotransferase [Thermanaerothrix sp.]
MIPISKPYIGNEEKEAVLEVLSSGMLAQGPKVHAFEERFAKEVTKTKHAIAVSSGTAALQIALLAAGIQPGDEVITTPFTFFATVSCVLNIGAKPVFVDINEKTFNIDADQIEAAITQKTRAILPVHLYGYPSNMNKIIEIAEKYSLIVIEDAAQAVGAKIQGRPVGSFGIGCFSFYATKNIMCGEGGMITTDDDEVAERCRLLRNHGMRQRYYHEILGYNLRMSDINAAIGLVQLDRLLVLNQKRKENADYFLKNLEGVVLPIVEEGYEHVWHQFTIRIRKNRDDIVKKLNEAGIGTGIFYPIPAYRQKPMENYGGNKIYCPVTEKVTKEVVSIPVHPLLSGEELEKIVKEINKCCG